MSDFHAGDTARTAPGGHAAARRRRLVLPLLIGAAVLGNIVRLPLLFGVDFLFGSIAVLVVARLYGLAWGVAAAAVAGAYTAVLWHHPYGLLLLVAEAAFVAAVLRRRDTSLIVADAVYWLTLGGPAAWLMYRYLLGMDATGVATVMLKLSVNGIFNALAASLVSVALQPLLHPPGARPRQPFRQLLFHLMMTAVLVPALVLMVIDGRVRKDWLEADLLAVQQRVTESVADSVDGWYREQMQAVEALAELAAELPAVPGDELQRGVRLVHRSFPDFHNMYVADASARTIAFHPSVNERGEPTIGLDFSDRAYYQQVRDTLAPGRSQVFMGRGGVFAPIVTLVAPVLRDGRFGGYALGALDLRELERLLATSEGDLDGELTLVDESGLVVASSGPTAPLAPFDWTRGFRVTPIGGGLFQRFPLHAPSAMQTWGGSAFVQSRPLSSELPWQLVLVAPLTRVQQRLYAVYIRDLGLMLLLALLAIPIGSLVSRRLVRPVRDLAEVTSDLPRRLMVDEPVPWPRASTAELDRLVLNFQSMADLLRQHLGALRDRNRDLELANERLVEEMNERERLESQFRQMQKMEAIGTLAGGIAHDFNNILTAMLGFAELAEMDLPEGHPIRDSLGRVRTAGNRARDLVQQILAFSRRQERERRPIDLGAVVGESLALLRPSLPSTIRIETTIGRVPPIAADATQMEQVLLNLCANAEHAMRRAGGTLSIVLETVTLDEEAAAARGLAGPGTYVRLRVRDTGHGMPPDVAARIFEPFFTTKQVGEGTGMGLAVVHGIVKGHDGAISVDSSPGAGTEFVIDLPLAEAAAPGGAAGTAHVPDAAAAEHAPAPPAGERERVLLVDDEEMLVRLGERSLGRFGYRVAGFTSPRAALDAFRAEPAAYRIVVTDQTMPEMTGDILVARLRELRPDLPVIVCTGFSHLMNDERAARLGIDLLLYKPVLPADLHRAIRKLLDR